MTSVATSRGTLRTYFGIAPGVGKTFDMLRDARAKHREGVDVVVAYLERHGRPGTMAQLNDLEIVPTSAVSYHETTFAALDVQAVLERAPALAIVDELARANLPGERHAKRWQDVDELLTNGIDVYTTLNVANVESLGHLVAKITGTPRAEPVPDEFVRGGEVKLVHLEPAALRRRLAEGRVFPPERADAALTHYFQFANLAALQELAQLWLDGSVDDPVEAYEASHGPSRARESKVILVALEGSPKDEWLIRYAADLADVSHARVEGIYVEVNDAGHGRPRLQLDTDRRLLADLSGTFTEVTANNVASALIETARKTPGAELVIGSPGGSRWARLLRGSTVGRVLRGAGDLPVQVVNVGGR